MFNIVSYNKEACPLKYFVHATEESTINFTGKSNLQKSL